MDLTLALERLRALVERVRTDVESRRLASCAGCAAPCCRVGRNGMLISPLEAASLARRLEEDPSLAPRVERLAEVVDATIETHRLRRDPDRKATYDCPFLVAGGGCLVHGEGQPLGCVAFMPTTADQEHCDLDEEAFLSAFEELADLNDAVFGEKWEPGPIPVVMRAHWATNHPGA